MGKLRTGAGSVTSTEAPSGKYIKLMVQSPQNNPIMWPRYSKKNLLRDDKLILGLGVNVSVIRAAEGQEDKGREKIQEIWWASSKLN